MTNRFPTVDADGHLEETNINWKERTAREYQSRLPSALSASW
jgi:hypothetical protein